MSKTLSMRDGGRWRGRWSPALLGVVVLVALALPATAGAAGRNLGGGPVAGTVSFDPGKEVPKAGDACATTHFSLVGSAPEATVANTVGTEYVGPVTIIGNGGSNLLTDGGECASNGGGSLTLTTVKGTGPTEGTLNCADPALGTTMTGTYLRVGTSVTANLTGTCKVNDFPARVNLTFEGQFVPTGFSPTVQPGINDKVSQATFAGPFAVTPTS